jgi:histidinol-phosphate aminotransferase
MTYLVERLSALGVQVIPSEANFVTFCFNENARPCYEALLKKGIIVRHLASFGMESCIRVTIGTQEHNRRFMRALRAVLGARG